MIFFVCTSGCAQRLGVIAYPATSVDVQWVNDAYNGRIDVNTRDARGRTPLMLATVLCFHTAAERFVERGADVQARDDEGRSVAAYLSLGRTDSHGVPGYYCRDDAALKRLFADVAPRATARNDRPRPVGDFPSTAP